MNPLWIRLTVLPELLILCTGLFNYNLLKGFLLVVLNLTFLLRFSLFLLLFSLLIPMLVSLSHFASSFNRRPLIVLDRSSLGNLILRIITASSLTHLLILIHKFFIFFLFLTLFWNMTMFYLFFEISYFYFIFFFLSYTHLLVGKDRENLVLNKLGNW